MPAKLKPCPFCGGTAIVRKATFNGRYIVCRNCKILFALSSGYDNADIDDRIREAWNRRANDENSKNL